MTSIAHIPLIDAPPEGGGEPRQITFRIPPVARRNFLRTVAVGGMALGLTGLSWIPAGRPAAAALTEYTGCAGYGGWSGYNNNTKRCVGGTYSTWYCRNNWFKDGCFRASDGLTDCFRPIRVCGAGTLTNRNAWRWTHNGYRWRCADGEYKCHSCGSWAFRICSARLWSV
ncbi:MAG: hypothetical protein GEU94_15860 [Micromonosporaceae bacterium]|nr:hypothetical protein [Micromonosporaceae bacterium]